MVWLWLALAWVALMLCLCMLARGEKQEKPRVVAKWTQHGVSKASKNWKG